MLLQHSYENNDRKLRRACGMAQRFGAHFRIVTKQLLLINSVRPGTNSHFPALIYARFNLQKQRSV